MPSTNYSAAVSWDNRLPCRVAQFRQSLSLSAGNIGYFKSWGHLCQPLHAPLVLCKDMVLQMPTWARSMGYRQATCSQLARMSTLPVLHFSGAQFAVKELSDRSALKVRPSGRCSACPANDGRHMSCGVQPSKTHSHFLSGNLHVVQEGQTTRQPCLCPKSVENIVYASHSH